MSASKLFVQLGLRYNWIAGLTRRQFAVRRGFHYESWLSLPPSQV